jgi:uncharacterized protein YggE
MATLTVVGRAEVSVPPDEAALMLVVDAVSSTASEALAAVAERTASVIALLDQQGVGAASRTTTGLSVSEEGGHDAEGRRQHRGYRASERLTVRVADAETVGRLVGEAVERANAQVQGPWWRVSSANPARLEALRAAGEDARSRADALAAGVGVRVGAVTEAVEGVAGRPEPRPGVARAATFAAAVPVEAGEATIESTVSVTFQVEQG